MSNVSGKCDFKDYLWMTAKTEEEAFDKFNGTKLYMRQSFPSDFSWNEVLKNNINIPETYYKKIEYSSITDLIPYYPYLTVFCGIDNTNSKNSVVCLSSESFVDREEREYLEFKFKQLLKIYNRCKRKKIDFNVNEVVKEITWNMWNEEAHKALANRIKESGKKATIDGIHLAMHEYYRQELVNDMLEHGLNPCKYGDYQRFVNEEV